MKFVITEVSTMYTQTEKEDFVPLFYTIIMYFNYFYWKEKK